MAGFSLVMVLKYLPDFLADKHNLILVSKYIEIFPTSVFATVLLESSTNFFSCFIIAISYFSIFNIILFLLNIYSAKMFKIKSYGKIYQKFSNKKSILTKLFINVAVNPFSKKDVAYTLRSIRTAPSHIMILFFLVIIPVTSLNDLVQYNQNITDQFSLSFLFISMIVLSFTANVFSFESNSIINYFYRPINYSAILKGKMFISNFYFLILSLGNLIIMLISKTKLLDAIFFEIAFLFSYLFLLLVSFPLSIFFPKKVSFTAMSGFLTSLISLFVFSIAAIIIWLMFYGYFQFYVVSVNKILALTCMFLSIIFFLYFKEKILSTIGKLLLIRKEKIIQVFK